MMSLALIVGIWSTTCIQTQISKNNQSFTTANYAKETYTFEKDGSYEFKREWFLNSTCTEQSGTDTEAGTVELGSKFNIFFGGEAYEANFNSQAGVDLGAISVKGNKTLKVARGVRNSNLRNTMLSLFEHTKQD